MANNTSSPILPLPERQMPDMAKGWPFTPIVCSRSLGCFLKAQRYVVVVVVVAVVVAAAAAASLRVTPNGYCFTPPPPLISSSSSFNSNVLDL